MSTPMMVGRPLPRMPAAFNAFFSAATSHAPYDYQRRLACGERADGETDTAWLAHGSDCRSQLINIPTGLGKTAAVVMAWLWNVLRQAQNGSAAPQPNWPTRLAYCLPMRTLVEQTQDNAQIWLLRLSLAATKDNSTERKRVEELVEQHRSSRPEAERAGFDRAVRAKWKDSTGAEHVIEGSLISPLAHALDDLLWLVAHSPIILMGGEELDDTRRDWDLYPEKPAILIGTQDMLLSRALNRGYGMSRYRWPMHFGLLNNDCLWVMDETQLMGSGLWTSAQLDWMRQDRFKTFRPTISWWMSATLGGSFFDTQDRISAKLRAPNQIRLSAKEEAELPSITALRPVEIFKPKPSEDTRKTRKAIAGKAGETDAFFELLAQSILDRHLSGTLSLIVCNRVDYAQRLYERIGSRKSSQSPQPILLTSRFRPRDRRVALSDVLTFEGARKQGITHPGLILVSTQVVEAGFDVSAARLWTEIAPWPSLLQRFGRLNRDAKLNDIARAYIFEVPAERGDTRPYDPADIKESAAVVETLIRLCTDHPTTPIQHLIKEIEADEKLGPRVATSLQPKPQPFPRAIDVQGLFSTEPDLFGGFTDVSPWIRNSDPNADATVFWRTFDPKKRGENQADGPGFQREEGCPVAVFRLREFLGKDRQARQWDSDRAEWRTIATSDIRPGMTLMLPAFFGGYDATRGWTGNKSDLLADAPPPGPFDKRDTDERQSRTGAWVALETHLQDTANVAQSLVSELSLSLSEAACLRRAAELHDIGKSLLQWQKAIPQTPPIPATLWAKFAGPGSFRPGFRHEVASALAMWHRYYREHNADFPALAIYIVAAHHGKARTVLTSLPSVDRANVCGIPINGPTNLPWDQTWCMDFEAARDGASGIFHEDGTFTFDAPGWTGLVADLLGGWEANAPIGTCGAVPDDQPAALGPFSLAFFETLLRACDGRASANPSRTIRAETSMEGHHD